MNNKLKCQVVMLPTKKVSDICLSERGNLQSLISNSSKNVNNHFKGAYQYLYLVSDREIKPKEKFIGEYDDGELVVATCMMYHDKILQSENDGAFNKYYKIEATTDDSLTLSDKYTTYDLLPQIPKSFTEEFVKAKCGIKEVNIDIVLFTKDSSFVEFPNVETRIITREDNTVIIHLTNSGND